MSSTRELGHALRLPTDEVGDALNAIPEDQWFDRKSFRIAPRELANVMIGLANADGGTLIVGVHDGKVEGTDSSDSHRNELMQAHVEFCLPPVPARLELLACRHSNGEKDQLLVIEIRPGETVYANVRDDVFLRIGDENRRLTYAQRQELLYDRGQGSYESRLVEGASPETLDNELLGGYATALDIPSRDVCCRLAASPLTTLSPLPAPCSSPRILSASYLSHSFACCTTAETSAEQEPDSS